MEKTGECHFCGSKDLFGSRLCVSSEGWDKDYMIVCAACIQKQEDESALNALTQRLRRNPELAKVLREVLDAKEGT